jgi:branched-chain amino acid transport system permease protein
MPRSCRAQYRIVRASALCSPHSAQPVLTPDEYNQHVVMWLALNVMLAVGLRFVLLVGETNIATGAFCLYRRAVHGELRSPMPACAARRRCRRHGGERRIWPRHVRTKGPYFMLISFAFTEVRRLIYTRINHIGGNSGIMGVFPPQICFATRFLLPVRVP